MTKPHDMIDVRQWLLDSPLEACLAAARAKRDNHYGNIITYSRKVFIPLTKLCRNVCHYCTFAQPPRKLTDLYLDIDTILDIARQAVAAGCKEALFTLGDKPEARFSAAKDALLYMGFETTLDYLAYAAKRVFEETGLLPHINAGVLTESDYALLRPVSASMGLMIESMSLGLCMPGQAHHGSPDKHPAVRAKSIELAGRARVAFTSGLLIGIGETRVERLDTIAKLAELHSRHGHIQEVIVQNFRAKVGTKMANADEPSLNELLWTISAARLLLPPAISIQVPPNLNPGATSALIDAGINDWGGISPVTIDHVNPEAPWPVIAELAVACGLKGKALAERLTVYPSFVANAQDWMDSNIRVAAIRHADASGLARDSDWSPGTAKSLPVEPATAIINGAWLDRIFAQVDRKETLTEKQLSHLFALRGSEARALMNYADDLRQQTVGDAVSYVVNRNINYTNICSYTCSFCAFSKSSSLSGNRDKPYVLGYDEIGLRVHEAYARGATEVCLQGGIHPSYTGETYLGICRAAKLAAAEIHVHAFSPLEIHHGATTLGLPLGEYLARLKDAGLASLPGTAAEILDDEIRAILCPDKVNSDRWIDIMRAAHGIGLPSTATIMFGHVDKPEHWARHLLKIRKLQEETGGFTEFVPLPFVHMRSPVYVRGLARKGPTWRETVLMHSIARVALHGAVSSIQASWVKLGLDGAVRCLEAGANDLGGVLMNESISRAAGADHGQNMDAQCFQTATASIGRPLKQRSTLYARLPH
jgi:FO synthase